GFVATPGRLRDLIRRGKVDISGVRYAVFDEADEMLQMGFQDELNAILAETPKEKNTLLFSATMSREVANIASRYMTNPVEITMGKKNAGAETVTHEYYLINGRDRYLALKRIVDNNPDNFSIIFCRTRRDTQEVADKLIQDGYRADSLHGELSQAQRDLVMDKFRKKHLQLLVATDVAARGLDVNDLTHVINYSLPDDIAGYTHRSGRTGRAGSNGTSIALVDMRERHRIRHI
ncbi:DEAD/DEAH box helicase, partial [Desulfobulbus sp. US1]|nr:DEAD/DEAH box helicase [Desulfobulbus sp. US1]